MVKIGLIIDKYHLEKKVKEFLEYCKNLAEVKLYVEEEFLLDFSEYHFDEDVFFAKAKGDLVLSMVKVIEKYAEVPVINSSKGIYLAFNRFLNSIALTKAGINVPQFSMHPIGEPPSYKEYIVKNIIDQKNYNFQPNIEKVDGYLHVFDMRALKETNGLNSSYKHLYYQEFIKSKWEYKVYAIGENLYFYKQLPILVNPDKMQSRTEISHIPELEEIAFKAIHALNLEISSIDFLKSNEDLYYLTDINSSPNFNYLKNGPQIVGDYLIKKAKR